MNENKRFQGNGWCVFDCVYKQNCPKKIGLTREQILLESLKKLCKAEGIQIYSTQ